MKLSDFERKAIEASAAAQEATGAPVGFHPGYLQIFYIIIIEFI